MGGNGNDIVVYRIIVTFMGVTLLINMVALCVLTIYHVEVPTTFGTISGAIIGSFSTMLMPSPGREHVQHAPQPQQIITK